MVLSSETASILMRTICERCKLQALEHPVQHTALGPAVHARIDVLTDPRQPTAARAMSKNEISANSCHSPTHPCLHLDLDSGAAIQHGLHRRARRQRRLD